MQIDFEDFYSNPNVFVTGKNEIVYFGIPYKFVGYSTNNSQLFFNNRIMQELLLTFNCIGEKSSGLKRSDIESFKVTQSMNISGYCTKPHHIEL